MTWHFIHLCSLKSVVMQCTVLQHAGFKNCNACLLFSLSTTAEQCQLSSPCIGRALRKAASCNPMLTIWTGPKVDNNTQQTTFLLNGCCFQHDSIAVWLSVKLQLFTYWKTKIFKENSFVYGLWLLSLYFKMSQLFKMKQHNVQQKVSCFEAFLYTGESI